MPRKRATAQMASSGCIAGCRTGSRRSRPGANARACARARRRAAAAAAASPQFFRTNFRRPHRNLRHRTDSTVRRGAADHDEFQTNEVHATGRFRFDDSNFSSFMIDQVKRILGLSLRKTGNKIIISVEKLERRVALLENGRLEEYSVERDSSRNIVGSVYKGRVKNIEMGFKAMFVDIGFEKNAFLHFWDAIPAALDSGVEEIERPRRASGRENASRPRIFRAFIRSAPKSSCR